jgi:hypothetical protein
MLRTAPHGWRECLQGGCALVRGATPGQPAVEPVHAQDQPVTVVPRGSQSIP